MTHLSNQDEPLTKGDLVNVINALCRVAEELSEEPVTSDTKTEQEPVTQTLNG